MPHYTPVPLPSAAEFLEFTKRSKAVNLDVPAATLLESADSILKFRPGYVLFNIRCGLLIIERPEFDLAQLQQLRNVQKEV